MKNETKTRYSVQRQSVGGYEWAPVSMCNSVGYARVVASAGLRRQLGACYRLIDNRTGATTLLFPQARRQAA